MYPACLFCHGSLGRNKHIEHFPVGKRLAYDVAKGRLWVVCARCARWNLTPLEQRWEAIEECEKAFRDSKRRSSTSEIGLARIGDDTSLIRVGKPLMPELASWRYGDRLLARRRRWHLVELGTAVAVPVMGYVGVATGLLGVATAVPVAYGLNLVHVAYLSQRPVEFRVGEGRMLRVRRFDLRFVRIHTGDEGLILRVPALEGDDPGRQKDSEFAGTEALRIASAMLPIMNGIGASSAEVTHAVGYLNGSADATRLFRRAVEEVEAMPRGSWFPRRANALTRLPAHARLALEMAVHEEAEQRAVDGEMAELEAAWIAAEEIAAIADNLLLPEFVDRGLARLKRSLDVR